MRRIPTVAWILLASIVAIAPSGLAQGLVPNPVVNPGFEADLPDVGPLEGSPADECIGVGHQVFFGSDSPQARAAAAAAAAADGNVSGAEENATRAADDADSPGEVRDEALFQAGYGHCVSSNEDGFDVAWLNPVRLAADDAVHWSGHDDDRVGDVDEDGDNEIAIPTDPESGHNLWQAWPSPFQAFTGNFEALEFRVENGAVPDGGLVQVSLSATPLDNQTAEVPFFRDCALNFPGDLINEHATDGQVSVPPTVAGFSDTGDEHCEDLAEAWTDATDDERRDILGRLRLVQLSFWRFHASPEDPACGCSVQLDDVSLSHATTVAEEVPSGNVRLGPDLG